MVEMTHFTYGRETMKEKVLEILGDLRPDIDFESETGLVSEGLLESFDLIQLIALLEEEFGIEIGNRYVTAENFDSLETITALVENLQK